MEGPQVEPPLGGAPPRPLRSPQGPPGVLEVWKKLKNSQKLYKKLSCRKIPQIITLTSIFCHLFHWGGPWGVKIFRGGGRVFPAPVEIFSKFSWLSFGHKNILRGVVRVIFDFTLLSPHPSLVHLLSLVDSNIAMHWLWISQCGRCPMQNNPSRKSLPFAPLVQRFWIRK